METQTVWFYPTTPVLTMLKARPASMALFEAFRMNPWKGLQKGIGDFCASHGVAWREFADALSGLKVPAADSDWKNLPIYQLLDFLAAEHDEFLFDFIPSVGHALSGDIAGDSESLYRLRSLVSEWPVFSSLLTEHIREEEDVLFLRILRYDSSLRLGWAHPDFEGGSVQVFTTIRMFNHEHRDLRLVRAFIDKVQPVYPGQGEPCALDMALHPLLTRFQDRLVKHARLETDVLLPVATAMEKKVYDQFITGGRGFQVQSAATRLQPTP